MFETTKWTPKQLYLFLNARYFRGALPNIPVVWSKDLHKGVRKHTMGSSWFDPETKLPKRITLNPKYKTAFALWAATLIHEMVHVQQWKVPEKQMHGRKFQKRMKQLAARGAFCELW